MSLWKTAIRDGVIVTCPMKRWNNEYVTDNTMQGRFKLRNDRFAWIFYQFQ